MSNNYSPDADDQMPEKKSSQQLLLLLLLLLVVLFVYLYFFTGLIKPRGEQAPKPQATAEAPVKKPLPPRPGAGAAQPGQPAAGPSAEHKAAVPPAQPAAAAKPGAPAKEAAAPTPAPAKEAAGPKHEAKDVGGAKHEAKEAAAVKPVVPAKPALAAKPAAVAGAKPAAPAPQAAAAKPAAPAAAKPAQPAAAPAKEAKAAPAAEKKPAAKPGAEAKAAPKGAAEKTAAATAKKPQAAAKPAAPAYALEVVGDLADSEIGPVLAKLKQAGISHVVQSKAHKGEPMHRLFLADFANRDEALEELERLKLAAPDAFLLKEGGRYAVYAGSYLREAKAASEQKRLLDKGVQLLQKGATIPVNVHKVRAGAFADQAAADKAVKALKKAGVSAKAVKLAQAKK
jgi:hypothetical protein